MRLRSLALCLLLPSLLCGQQELSLTDWPQWRGPDRQGTWYNGPETDTLFPGMLQVIWAVKVGPGYNGPTLSDGKVYVMDYMDGNERVISYDAESGKKLWSYSYPVSYSVGYPTGPRASVLVSEGKAYSWGTMGHLKCFEAATGQVLWQINTLESYKVRLPIWGLASNLLMANDKLIVQLGGESGACLVAFHKDTGREIWRALEDEASYSAPLLIQQAGKRVVVCWTGESISGLDLHSGQVYWSLPFVPGNMIMNIADPVYDPPYLFLSGFFDGSYLLELDQETPSARLIYHRHGSSERKTEALHCCISTPQIRNGYVYGIGSYGEGRCLDLLTGERIWEDLTLVPKARWANVHLVKQGEMTWGFNELGELLLGRFTPEGYVDRGRVKVIDPVSISPNPRNGVCWSHPAFSGRRIFIRSDDQLLCIQVNSPG